MGTPSWRSLALDAALVTGAAAAVLVARETEICPSVVCGGVGTATGLVVAPLGIALVTLRHLPEILRSRRRGDEAAEPPRRSPTVSSCRIGAGEEAIRSREPLPLPTMWPALHALRDRPERDGEIAALPFWLPEDEIRRTSNPD